VKKIARRVGVHLMLSTLNCVLREGENFFKKYKLAGIARNRRDVTQTFLALLLRDSDSAFKYY